MLDNIQLWIKGQKQRAKLAWAIIVILVGWMGYNISVTENGQPKIEDRVEELRDALESDDGVETGNAY